MAKKRLRAKITYEGKPYYVSGHSKKELEKNKAKKRLELESGAISITSSMSVKEFGKIWYTNYRKYSNASVEKNKDYKSRLFTYIYPAIGYQKLSKVTAMDLQGILNNMADQGFSKDRISKVKQCLVQLFNKAEANQLIISNPTKFLELPKAEDGSGRELTKDERRIVLKTLLNHEFGSPFLIILFAGLRPGEIRRIKKEHIDFEDSSLYVDGTKSLAAKRTVPLPLFLTKRLCDELKNKKIQDYAFTNEWGNPLTNNNIKTRWHAVKRSINILMGCKVYRNQVLPPYWTAEDLVPYCLRHTYYNDLRYSKTPYSICEELMGHAMGNVSDTYTHKRDTGIKLAKKELHDFWIEERIIDSTTGKLFGIKMYNNISVIKKTYKMNHQMKRLPRQ
ncbi:integrase [Clostridiales Family XIII bacterium PM5-7]